MTKTGSALLAVAVLLAGCAGPPETAPIRTAAPPRAGPGEGIDMASDASDVLRALASARVEFVGRYYRDPDSALPPLTPAEARRLSAAGIKIVAVYEYRTPDRAHFTYQGGYDDATIADREARGIGQPAGSAIYFAVDFHARADDLATVLDYIRGVRAGLAAGGGTPAYAVGIYGSGPVCEAVRRAGLARYSWLSNSINWDDASDYDDWNIMQGAAMPGLPVRNDSDQARDSDYGAFEIRGEGSL